MRSFGRWAAAIVCVAALTPTASWAQSTQVAELYKQALAREATLRKQVDATGSSTPASTTLLQRIRTLTNTYKDLWRLFPTSGYSDNALWQGAMLAADAFWHFGNPEDRVTSLALFQALTANFPTSSLVKQVPAQVTRLKAAAAASPVGRTTSSPVGRTLSGPPGEADKPRPTTGEADTPRATTMTSETDTPRPTAATGGADRPRVTASTAPPGTTSSSVLTGIRREVLPDVLRVTLQLEREPVFFAERIDGPPRIFVDMQNTRASAAIRDANIPFPDDVVRQIRVGRQLNGRTRVVLDLSAAGKYSVYSLYNPYRIVIDIERQKPLPRAVRPGEQAALKSADAGATWPASPPAAATPTPAASTSAPPATRAESRPTVAVPAGPASQTAAAGTAAAPLPPAANSTGTFSLSRQLGLGVARIVIDPGHGGHDPGAKARGLTEADLTLDIALRLEKLLAKESGVEVVLTRRTDTYVQLEERTAIANRSAADLFLSIHANASKVAAARGIETYFLNFAPDPAAEAIAARENASSAKTMRNLPDIVKAIAMNNKIDESRDFASIVQASLYDKLRASNRQLRNLGVKQAPFMVLIGATMPSILAEISFITNSQEGALLKTEKYRQQIAEALFQGVMRYQQSLKKAPAIALGPAAR